MSEEPKCPKCESPMNVRVNRQEGTEFLGCSKYPECKGTRAIGCPKCGEAMVKRKNKTTQEEFLGCSKYPECKGTRKVNKPAQGNMTVSPELQDLIDTSDDNDPF